MGSRDLNSSDVVGLNDFISVDVNGGMSEDGVSFISLSGSTDVSRRSDGKRVSMFVLDADLTVRSGTISSELIDDLSLWI